MKAKYCIVPDTAKFFEFLAGLSFSESDLLHTRLIRPQKIFVDVEQSEWVIEYKAAAPVEERLALAVADKLAAAFSLHKVELSCCNAEANVKAETEEIPLPPEPPEETEFVVTNCSGQPIPEEIPLPEEPPQNDLESYHYEENGSCGSEADADFARAYELLYGNGGKGKNGNGVIWGKNFRGEPRPLDDITEEENNVVVEGQFVKCFDKDGVLTSLMLMEVMLEKKEKLSELRKGLVIYPQVLKNIRVNDKPAARADEDVIEAVKKVEQALGENGRILLRESGTEPVIRVMVEAETQELCERYVDDVIAVLKAKGHEAK